MLPSKKLYRVFPFLSILLTCIASFYAAISHRSLMHDGSSWFFHILKQGFFYDHNYTRYFTLVLESPAVILLKFFPDIDIKWYLASLDFPFSFHSLISLFFCFLILKQKNRLEIFIFPMLSYATATLSTISFSVGIAPDSLSLFWPLLMLVLYRNPSSRNQYVWCLVLSTALMFTYEMSVIFFIIISLVQYFKSRNSGKSSDWVLLIINCIGGFYCTYRIIGPTSGNQNLFWSSLEKPLDPFRIFIILEIALFFILLWCLVKLPRMLVPKIVVTFSIAVALFYSYYFFLGYFTIYYGYYSRVTAIPVSAVIALGCIIVDLKYLNIDYKNTVDLRGRLLGLPVLLVSIVLFTGSLYDIKFTHKWNKVRNAFYEYYKDKTGCIETNEVHGFHLDWSAPYTSIFLQQSRKIKWIVFARDADKPNSCQLFADGYIHFVDEVYRVDNHPYFDFSVALEEARKNQALEK